MGIRVGLDAIAGLPQNLKLLLYEERDHNGPYTSLVELIARLKPGAETLALLVQSGACDCFGLPRPVLYLQAETELRRSTQELFAPRIPDRWAPVQVSKLHKAHDEWQTLGFTLEMPLIAMLRSGSEYTMPVGFGNMNPESQCNLFLWKMRRGLQMLFYFREIVIRLRIFPSDLMLSKESWKNIMALQCLQPLR
ncbi:MAG: hypothetical protein EBT02_10080 [Planctomycetia bacterium]|nr:hypothetical protein [Planctomycetia bacterium]